MKTKEKKSVPTSSTSGLGFYIVGAGASAGGLEAFTALVKAIEPNSGVAYVLLQHLEPTHPSLLPDLLRKWAKVPVVEITNDLKPEPDHIYVQPSNKLLGMAHGKFLLEPLPKEKHTGAVLIDHFFDALANHQRERAVGVVLSGTASDGTEGLQMIKQHGGITIAQDEASAKWTGMPHHAAKDGHADHILSPEMIPSKILELINPNNPVIENATTEDDVEDENDTIQQILELLHKFKGKDFGQYKKTTVGRRIRRRMSINNLKDLDEYSAFLNKNNKELEALYDDMLIPVTEFFRDQESFAHLCDYVLPQIIAGKTKSDALRVWVAGCSTGEEAYSMAICILELLEGKEGSRAGNNEGMKLQIIATDISQPSLSKARKGIYTKKETKGLSNERLDRFFIKATSGYRVKKKISDLCLFAEHNFLSDPPFSDLDLVSCRNVMIYMEDDLKKKAQTNFHYGLRPDGWLWLGKSEANTASKDLFSVTDKMRRLFKRQDVPARITIARTMRGKNDMQTIGEDTGRNSINFEKIADAIVLENYTPTGVVVNPQLEIVHYRGRTQDYLVQKSGKPSHNLIKLAKAGLGFELRNIIERARREQHKVTKADVPLKLDDHIASIHLEAIPLKEAGEGYVLVLFRQLPVTTPEKGTAGGKTETKDNRDRRIAQLERELVQAREDMRAIVENQEVANEELQSANEELMSSSEELQTLNEELETSKEELQSANEETTVANQELQGLNEEVTKERNYAETVIMVLREPLIVLDSDLRVQTANRSFYENFKVGARETKGRLIYELGNNQWDIPKLRRLLEDIIPDKGIMYDYEVTHNFESIGTRTMLLNATQIKNEEKDIKLILLTIEDITERKKMREELEDSVQRYNELIRSSSYMIAVLEGPDLIVRSANEAILKQLGKGNIIGQPYLKAVPELEEQGLGDLLREVYKTGEHHDSYEAPVTLRHDGEDKLAYYNFVYQPQRNRDGAIIGVSIIAIEVTPQAELKNQIKKTVHEFEEFIYSSSSLIAILKGEDLKVDIVNDAMLKDWGKERDIIGMPFQEAVPALNHQGFYELLLEVYRSGKTHQDFEVPAIHERNGKLVTDYYDFVYQPQRDGDGMIIGVAIIAHEVTPKAVLNKKIKDSVHEYEEFIYSSPNLKAIIKGEDLRIEIVNEAMLKLWGKDKSVIGKPLPQAIPDLVEQGYDTHIRKTMHTGKPYHAYEVPVDGEREGKMVTGYYNFVYQPQRNREGEIVGVAVVAYEVTPQAKLHQQIKESEEKFREMANLIPDKITLADATGRAIYCNESWKDYLNVSQAEFSNLKIKELAHPDEYEKVKTAIIHDFARGKNVELEARIKNAQGQYKWHLVRARPMKDDQGNIVYWITATTQIHKIKLEEKRKEDFLKMVSHELKTPVTSIKGYTQLLLSMLKEKKAKELDGIPLVPSLERINNQVSRLTRLISEMLDLSRVEESKLDLRKEIFNMNELVRNNVQDIKYSSKESQINIIEKDHFKVKGDKDRIGQVLINFITNAIKYSPDDQNIEVTVYKTEDGDGAVAVKDNGIGIAERDIDNIFKRFYRVSGKNEETYSGFGIGLYLAQEIIKRHGGTISVNSKLGEGSEFIFTLPTID